MNSNDQRQGVLGMFAKYWQPGRVKTRLAAGIGPEAAAELYREFVQVLVRRLSGIGQRRVLCIWPPDSQPAFDELTQDRWTVEPQSAGDLGHRMAAFFRSQFTHGAERVVLIGSDSPTLPATLIHEALAALQTHRVVLGPTDDGGYYLVGASGSPPPIFREIDWGTANVWRQTLSQLAAAGIRRHELPRWYDVDRVEDLTRLYHELQGPDLAAEPRFDRLRSLTRRYVDSCD